MRRRRYLAASLGLAATTVGPSNVIAVAAQEATGEQDDSDPLRFDGTGASVTDEFELEAGVTIAEATHDGKSNFIVELVPTDDGRDELLVNVIGDFDGASGVLVDEGTYLLDIDADGDWELEVFQPVAMDDDAEALPVDLEGTEPTWAGPFQFDGLGQAHGIHEGERNFIVEILPQDGRFSELVFNEIGQFDGETTFDVDGIGYVTIEADGPWSLALE